MTLANNDPFAVFGVAPGYDLDLTALEKRHRELSRALHPDRFAASGAGERRHALSRAVTVNEAWRQLRDPVSRAAALLRHLGVATAEENEPRADPEFLMQMLELREELGKARGAGDEAAVQRLAERAKAGKLAAQGKLSELFRRTLLGGGKESGSEEARAEDLAFTLRRTLGELRYYQRFLDEVRAFEDDWL